MTKLTEAVLSLIAQERLRQDEMHGAQRQMPLTRPGLRYMDPENVMRATYESRKRDGTLSHADIILEESAEAFDAATPEEQLQEAVEAAACWVKAVEALLNQQAMKRFPPSDPKATEARPIIVAAYLDTLKASRASDS